MNNRQTDETKTTGGVAITDATAAGTIQFGEHGAIEFDSEGAVDATAVFTPLESYNSGMYYELGVYEDGVLVNEWAWDAQDGDTAQELVDALNDLTGQYWQNTNDIEAALEGGKVVLRRIGMHGVASNGYSVVPYTVTPFVETEEKPIAGGVDARTPQEVVDALNASEDCPYEAELEEESIVLTAPVAGEEQEQEIAVTGGLFGDVTPMTTVMVTSYEAEPNHEYRVFSDYAGDVYAISGGTRIWRGTLEAGQPHPVCTGADTTGFEVETPAGRYVKVHDPEAPKQHVSIPTEQGKFYQIYSDDAFRVLHNGMVLAQQVYFGGVSVFHAAYRTTMLEVAEDATFSVTECPPPDPTVSNRSTVVFQHNIETMNL